MPMRLRPAGVRSPNATSLRAPSRLFTLSAARPLAPRRSSAAFIALPTRSIRSFATTTTTTNETVTSDTSEQTSKQNGSIHHEPPTAPVPAGIAPLPHRTIVCVSGEMAAPFLNGLATNKVPSWLNQVDKGMQGLYTGILNAQGRVMFDCFMYPTTVLNKDGERVRAMYIEVDKHIGTKLMFNLKRYRLRTRVNLEYARDRGVFAAWGPGFGEQKDGNVTQTHLPKPGELITFNDPRIPGFGTRYVVPLTDEYKASSAWTGPPNTTDWELPEQLQSIEALKSLPRVSTDHYHIRRYLAGLPEGPQEVLCDDSLPLECNMDLMRGIDFQKGCYVGQELTIRTKHTGVVRKRVLPVRLYNLDANNLAAAKVPSKLELVKEEDGFWGAHEIGALRKRSVSGIRPAAALFTEAPEGPKPISAAEAEAKDDDEDAGEEVLDAKLAAKEAAKAVRQYRRQNRAVGTFLNGIGNIGLALCRLDALTDVRVAGWEQQQSELGRSYAPNEKFGIRWKKSDNDSETEEAAAGIKAFVPAWHRERMEEEESARAEERRRRRAAVEAGRRLVEQGELVGETRTTHKRRHLRSKAKQAMQRVLRGEEVLEDRSVWDTIDETAEEREARLRREQEEQRIFEEMEEEEGDADDYEVGVDKGITHRLNKEQLKELRKERRRNLKAKRELEPKHLIRKEKARRDREKEENSKGRKGGWLKGDE
ncbi:hypothetical protein IWZ03DRAFT_377862 [Phyllosticta citriasiana]|uniref:Iron-sulfur cluster assembly factor IBA57 homolog, mitochondrial n=1 Tax=Phyllosticta citriasiana TaxID=595635 RepID=A0ABR1KJT7_9PEZI